MELANLIHPALGILTALAILTAYGLRLLKTENHGLHYAAGLTATVAIIFAVIRAVNVAQQLEEFGIETPPVMDIHGFNALLVGGLLAIQATLGIIIWLRKPDIPVAAYTVHTLVGPLLALVVIVQIVLGVLTMLGLMG